MLEHTHYPKSRWMGFRTVMKLLALLAPEEPQKELLWQGEAQLMAGHMLL